MDKRSRRVLVDTRDNLQKLRERVETLREDKTASLYEIDGSAKDGVGTEEEAAHEALVSAVGAIDEAIEYLENAGRA